MNDPFGIYEVSKRERKKNSLVVGGTLGAASGGAAATTAPRVGDSLYRGIKRKTKETKAGPPKETPKAKKIKDLMNSTSNTGEKAAAKYHYEKTMKALPNTPAKKTYGAWRAAGKLVKTPKRGAYIAGAGLIGTGTALGVGAGKAFEDKRKRS